MQARAINSAFESVNIKLEEMEALSYQNRNGKVIQVETSTWVDRTTSIFIMPAKYSNPSRSVGARLCGNLVIVPQPPRCPSRVCFPHLSLSPHEPLIAPIAIKKEFLNVVIPRIGGLDLDDLSDAGRAKVQKSINAVDIFLTVCVATASPYTVSRKDPQCT